ncbi:MULTISPECIES: galactose ABC transporter substrate-binding protein [Clostridium]|jgi:ABC-type sugar transport system, periplasmic component|uniref:D-galactose/methyl-galactoside binding periplasmic protein MglB n=5 Tax=Clostridium TaxID=1485 RepID=A0A1S8R2P1_CLOBE|nr:MULTISPECIES: galactose ABC transporter substrate-binding protein [Clostridium]ABR36543.1 periplasmic binding protein/LacI transcriptional regulator [Clostridium beijerinckii NCIMB 8052]AIU03049.1 periplasmic binding protein/LacI transcriptional regulator [Clostridium beijerinckii ATCC 35702]AQS07290.1 D-galactose-binding periplasmic protein precursor [Clostridium beijerinckii]AVK48400.1 sugar ABC transporter substrate-binding protein [Clostridium sp. MF28]MBA2887958.1 methyl-galactoside tr
MKRFKSLLTIVMSAAIVATMAGCGANKSASSGGDAQTSTKSSNTLIGSAIYKFDDTFMTGVRTAMEGEAKEKGSTIELVDSQNKQPTQNEQVDTFITKGVNALAINPVDRTAAGPIIEKAKAKKLPIVFLNREPEKADMDSYDKVWYVGAHAEQSGTLSGQLIADYFKAHPEADKNHDGVVQYVMLQGEPGHQDATLRTEYSIKAIEAAGLKTQKLAADTAMWDKAKATDLMKAFMTGQGVDKIEAVLCNNDDMALGAVEALKAEGYNKGDASKYIPVVGVDATAPALQAMKEGSLLGTVLNDAQNQGKATVNIALAAAQGKEINKENVGFDVTDGKYVWIDYVKVTQDNYKDYLK